MRYNEINVVVISMNELSRTQIDKLGERLKKDEVSEEDLRLLDQFRQSFAASYQEVVEKITNELGLAPTGRLAKSTASISEKLRRESVRLNQIQDIAGCRIIVDNMEVQDQVVNAIRKLFDKVTVIDRRFRPSHGYRAVHLVIKSTPRAVEVQVRTSVQQMWAELSEKLADKWGQNLKYGSGDKNSLKLLAEASELGARYEQQERILLTAQANLTRLSNIDSLGAEAKQLAQQVLEMSKIVEELREAIAKEFLRFK
jgi:putative GTP pyrophosphokinase